MFLLNNTSKRLRTKKWKMKVVAENVFGFSWDEAAAALGSLRHCGDMLFSWILTDVLQHQQYLNIGAGQDWSYF